MSKSPCKYCKLQDRCAISHQCEPYKTWYKKYKECKQWKNGSKHSMGVSNGNK